MFSEFPFIRILPGRRDRWDIFDFVRELGQGEPLAWGVLGVIVGCIAFLAAYKKITGKSLVKSKRERREARRRGKHVVWEYERED